MQLQTHLHYWGIYAAARGDYQVMSGQPLSQSQVMEYREQETGEAEPLLSHDRKVRQEKQGGSLFHNIPSEARDISGLEKGDDVTVHVFDWGWVVEPANSEK